ncbi:MAG: hypothetical protein WEB85_07400 [Dongiaceae bacterium]
MQFPIKVSWPVEPANTQARKGTLGKTVQSIIDELKPEAAHFCADRGKGPSIEQTAKKYG